MTPLYIVNGWNRGRVEGQWVIAASSEDVACLIAERRQVGRQFTAFTAELDSDGLFEAEENLSEED